MFSDRTLEGLFRSMNSHVPAIRPSLAYLLEMKEPFYTDRNGNKYSISKDELRDISNFVDKWDIDRLKIPILIMTDTNYENGHWKVIGRVETKVISRIIQREPEKEDEILIFYPQLMLIRKRFPTITNSMYMP